MWSLVGLNTPYLRRSYWREHLYNAWHHSTVSVFNFYEENSNPSHLIFQVWLVTALPHHNLSHSSTSCPINLRPRHPSTLPGNLGKWERVDNNNKQPGGKRSQTNLFLVSLRHSHTLSGTVCSLFCLQCHMSVHIGIISFHGTVFTEAK